MGAGHDHGGGAVKFEKPLWIALALTTCFLIVEVVGAFVSNSLALLSDAAHMGTDVIALAISLFAVRLGKRPADAKRTYGYARMEAIGALINGGLLFSVAGFVLWEALGRFLSPPPVASNAMLLVAAIGLVINLISMRLLKAGAGENLNMKGAYLEVWSDMLGSVGVIIGALVIRMTGWTVVDPIIAVLIGLWVLPRTWILLKQSSHILMQGVPDGLDLDAVRASLAEHPAVAEVHDLHAWALGSKDAVLTVHVVMGPGVAEPDRIRSELAELLHDRFDVEHATIQVEAAHCGGHALHA
jgi:cobalt-zinc-cadmium efflux system protein